MRLASVLMALLVACGGPPKPVVPRADSTEKPATDLKDAQTGVTHVATDDGKLTAKDPRVVDLDIIRVKVDPRTGESSTVATADLFQKAGTLAKEGKTAEAMAIYRQLVTEFPESSYAPISMFNIAAIFDGRGDYPATVLALEDLVKTYPQSRESVEGHMYIAALHAEHKDWQKASTVLDAVLARQNLSYADRVEGFARKGYVEIELDQKGEHLDAAEKALDAAMNEYKIAPHIEDPYYIAMATYYRGETAHKRFELQAMRLPDDQLLKDAEQKRILAGRAYDRWKEALKYHQPYWATASGYQMSQIFFELWDSLVRAPYPAKVAVDQRKVYVTELHDKSREHLEKALEGHRMNVELAKAYGVDTTWSKGSEDRVNYLIGELAKDNAGVYVTP